MVRRDWGYPSRYAITCRGGLPSPKPFFPDYRGWGRVIYGGIDNASEATFRSGTEGARSRALSIPAIEPFPEGVAEKDMGEPSPSPGSRVADGEGPQQALQPSATGEWLGGATANPERERRCQPAGYWRPSGDAGGLGGRGAPLQPRTNHGSSRQWRGWRGRTPNLRFLPAWGDDSRSAAPHSGEIRSQTEQINL